MATTRVYLEEGRSSVFAVAIDWPGWCRRAKTSDLAIEALDAYRARYERVLTKKIAAGRFEVIGTLKGDATTDFGAPSKSGTWDEVAKAKTTLFGTGATEVESYTTRGASEKESLENESNELVCGPH